MAKEQRDRSEAPGLMAYHQGGSGDEDGWYTDDGRGPYDTEAQAEAAEIETVNHPDHYGGDTTYEVIKVLEAWGLNDNARLWNAVKYISRAGKKGDYCEDLKKARFYLDREIEICERADEHAS